MSVTDHDTTLATRDVRTWATEAGIEAVSGIEITAVEDGRDVHILGYFVRDDDPGLASFLSEQRLRRVERVQAIGERLASLGMPVDVEPILAEARLNAGSSVGRPQVARAMVTAGHATSVAEAFDKWLGHARPGYVARNGPACERVISAIHDAGGLASLAHPIKTSTDQRILALCAGGLDAIEAYHSDHDPVTVDHYLALAATAGVLVTGGSDFHGDPGQGREPGCRTLPQADWQRLKAASGTYACRRRRRTLLSGRRTRLPRVETAARLGAAGSRRADGRDSRHGSRAGGSVCQPRLCRDAA
jgi:predicted metal-dependent phosphoesterase TrpH